MPTYHFANIIDDYEMKITHVIRKEWTSNLRFARFIIRSNGMANARIRTSFFDFKT